MYLMFNWNIHKQWLAIIQESRSTYPPLSPKAEVSKPHENQKISFSIFVNIPQNTQKWNSQWTLPYSSAWRWIVPANHFWGSQSAYEKKNHHSPARYSLVCTLDSLWKLWLFESIQTIYWQWHVKLTW